MFEEMKHDSSLSSYREEWYGTHFIFHSPSHPKKEWVDVIYYPSLQDFSYRYVLFSFWKPYTEEGVGLPYQNENLPFWVRKIFYKFKK